MAKTQKVSKIKTKKKRWFPILAPKFLGQKEIGESYLNEAKTALGRVMKINLRDLTGNIRDQNIHISLKISEVEGNNLQTEIVGYNYVGFFIKKLARRKAGKIDDSFVVETKEKKGVRLKPLVVTVFAVNKSVKTAIRKKIKSLLEKEVSKLSFESLIMELLRYKLQMDFKKKLNKVCPVKDMVMRVVKLEEIKKKMLKKEGKQVTKNEEETKNEEDNLTEEQEGNLIEKQEDNLVEEQKEVEEKK